MIIQRKKLHTILIPLILFTCIESIGQIKFESDSTSELTYEHIVRKPEFDSIQFVFRFWQSSKHVPGVLLELVLQRDGHWKYRRGYVNTKKGIFIVKQLIVQKFNLDSIWAKLVSVGILQIKDQVNSQWIRETESGKRFPVKPSADIYDRNGDLYILEFISNERIRQINYMDPFVLQKMMLLSRISSEDHDKLIKVIDILNAEFKLTPLFKECLLETFSKPSGTEYIKTKKRDNRF
ncbi:MAG: hypothetical protein HOP30_20320 [Cyclobacteriaceae bacterium]|nr:hypothetical protein [Cyclobacteriaceae bacterium]